MTIPSKQKPMPTTDRGLQTRQRLLGAAERIFGAEGYHEASITHIVEAAGVGQGTYYLYFAQKRDIFVALVGHLARALREEIHAGIQGARTREEIERQGFRAFFRFVEKHPHAYRIVRQAEFVDQEVFRDYYRSLARGYRRGLQAAIDAGEFARLDTEAVSYALMGVADFIGMRYVLWQDPPGTVPDAVIEDLMRLLLPGLRGGLGG